MKRILRAAKINIIYTVQPAIYAHDCDLFLYDQGEVDPLDL